MNERPLNELMIKKLYSFISKGLFFCNNCYGVSSTLYQKKISPELIKWGFNEYGEMTELKINRKSPSHLFSICPICNEQLKHTPQHYKIIPLKHNGRFLPTTKAIKKIDDAKERWNLRIKLTEAVINKYFEEQGDKPPALLRGEI